MKLLNKEELNETLGKIGIFDNPIQLVAKLDYVGGIEGFDNVLNGQSQKDYDAVIHIIKRPKGFQIKLAENFSSNSIGLILNKIEKVVIEHKDSIIKNKNKSVIGRAVLGGLLLGPIGAIVGGLSGLKSGQEVILPDSILTIHYKSSDIKTELFFSCNKENIKETSNFFKSVGLEIQEIFETSEDSSLAISNIDKLERLAKLKADGFLTTEEFEGQKKKLL
ncbi:MAG: hypothetical protein RJA07_1216 [Bacteroidota bacterium]|jgi:hypothetical protein